MILSLDQVSKSYGASLILESVTAKIEDSDRIGLIGPNGAGKTTLLELIVGELEADDGEISRSGGKSFGYLRQNGGLADGGTIRSEMRGVFSPLLEMEREMRALEGRMERGGPDAALTAEYARLQTVFEQRGGYLINVKIATVLNGMGFLGVDTDMPVEVLSGGEKTRLALCKLLLEEPDLLILDEPTNHLDFRTLQWLEEYLAGCKGALLAVSHDRYFLDRLCRSIWDLEHRRLTCYPGNYSRSLLLKEERLERQRREYEAQRQEIAEIKDFVARNIVRASTTARAQSRQKALDRMELVERPRPSDKPAALRFEYKREPVKDVLAVENLHLSVGGEGERKQLLCGVGLELRRGDKVALIGANGVGKSSFLKALQKMIPIDKGHISWGQGVQLSYFEQEEFALHSDKTALDELWDRFPREYEHTIRTVLGRVRLTGENVYKRVSDLSGGERARLKLAILLLSCGNVLIMDEPTNHLDLSTKEALDSALSDYTGTLLVVSHDRYLLNKFPTHIAEMHPDRIRVYPGNYDRYLAAKRGEETDSSTAESAPAPAEKPRSEYHRSKKQRSEDVQRKQRITRLEETIEELEREIFRLEERIADPGVASDYPKLQEACALLEEKRLQLGCGLNEWAALCEQAHSWEK